MTSSSLCRLWVCAGAVSVSSVAMGREAADDCVGRVRSLFRQNSAEGYLASAKEAERCWVIEQEAQLLSFAAQARVNLKHGAHAAIDLFRYVRLAPEKREDRVVKGLLREITSDLVVVVEVSVSPAPSGAGELVAVFLSKSDEEAYSEARGEIIYSQEELAALRGRLWLDPGRWRLAWRVGETWAAREDITAVEGRSVTLVVGVEPNQNKEVGEVEALRSPGSEGTLLPEEPAAAHMGSAALLRGGQRRALVLGSAGGVSLGVGVGLLVHAERGATGSLSGAVSPEENGEAGRAIADNWMYRWSGGGLVGAGLGGGVVAVTELAQAPWGVLVGELVAGAATLTGGIVWSTVNFSRYRELMLDGFDADLRQIHGYEALSGMLVGFGAGVLSGAAVSLVWRAVSARRRR